MPTLLLRCVAPLQAWDTQSRFGVRTTGREPSKSGIIGLLCAALGRPRTAPVADLAALRMGVRVDKEGSILRDWHTAQNVLRAGGGLKDTETSTRYYLSDAAFLVGLEGERLVLEQLHAALRNPYWLLFLGRKACPPSLPIYLPDGLCDDSLAKVLAAYPWLGSNPRQYQKVERLRLVLDDDNGVQVRHDHPISFAKDNRQFAPRRVRTDFIAKPPFVQSPDALEASGNSAEAV
jgi:CRISPR system Cascade subunit CasD